MFADQHESNYRKFLVDEEVNKVYEMEATHMSLTQEEFIEAGMKIIMAGGSNWYNALHDLRVANQGVSYNTCSPKCIRCKELISLHNPGEIK